MINFRSSCRVVVCGVVMGLFAAGVAATGSVAGAHAQRLGAVGPSGEAMPVGDVPGWRQVLADDFTTNVALGSFPTVVTPSSKWTAYPSPWKDTSGFGTYSPATVVSVGGGLLNEDIHTAGGVAMVAALRPSLSTMTYGRYAVRYRFDSMAGYKMAFMLWPDSNDGRGEGELDFPEMNLDATTSWAFAHRTNSTGPDDQAWFKTPLAAGAWHTAVIEWSPNLVVFSRDGVEVGRTWVRTPSTPMHWVLQTETAVDLTAAPDPAVHGNVQIDWAAVWAYDPTTADTTAPTAAITTPANGATVAATQALAVAATDDVGVVGVQFKVDGANVGAEVTTTPYTTAWNSALASDGPHTVQAVVRDIAGNLTTATATVTAANTAQDVIAPVRASSVPTINATIFPVSANINAQFSEAVTGVDSTSFTLRNTATGTPIPATVTYTLNTNQSIAVLNPVDPLTDDTKYTLALTSTIVDRSGNRLNPTSWSFVTGPAPTVTPQTPPASATNVSRTTTITAHASEDLINVGPASFIVTDPNGVKLSAPTITFNPSNDTLTYTPSATLKASTRYTVTLTNAIKDTIGNPLATTSWNFTTGP